MPIDIDAFDAREHHREPTTSERVVRFLLANADRAFTRREIAEAIEVAPETVGTNLTRLKARGHVRHREPYWTITEDRAGVERYLRDRHDRSDDVDGGGSRRREGDEDGEATVDESVHRSAARSFSDRVMDAVGDAVAALYLFGSVASETASPDSDVDVLVVVAEEADFAAIDDRLLEIAYDVQLEYDVPVEVHSVRKREFVARRRRGEPFVRSVVEDGVVGG